MRFRFGCSYLLLNSLKMILLILNKAMCVLTKVKFINYLKQYLGTNFET